MTRTRVLQVVLLLAIGVHGWLIHQDTQQLATWRTKMDDATAWMDKASTKYQESIEAHRRAILRYHEADVLFQCASVEYDHARAHACQGL
jgi:hypothetical protein